MSASIFARLHEGQMDVIFSVLYTFVPCLSSSKCAIFGSWKMVSIILCWKHCTTYSIILGSIVPLESLPFGAAEEQAACNEAVLDDTCFSGYLSPFMVLVLLLLLSRSPFQHISICIHMQPRIQNILFQT